MTQLSVYSEIAQLDTVVIHSPGPEVDHMTPSLMHDLLFDDILFGNEARQEHEVFRKILAKVANRVLDIQDLFVETLANEEARKHFLSRFKMMHDLTDKKIGLLNDMAPEQLAAKVTGGWFKEIDKGQRYRFITPPTPNLLFMRDPCSVIGDGVSINKMATDARNTEPIILESVMHYHPVYGVDRESQIWFDASLRYLEGHPEAHHSIEGGDILVLSDEIVAIGISIRTKQSTVTMLAEQLRKRSQFKTLIAVLMPHERSAMHLDTIFTQVDEENCLIFPPYLDPSHSEVLPALKMDLSSKELSIVLKPSLLQALKDEGFPLNPIFCGGHHRIDQEREQWTDGANSFCLAPGVILMYDRNTKTMNELESAGFKIREAESVLKYDINLLDGSKYAVMIRGNELSRARGGPRCMTMPLKRMKK
ncbi:MAG: hypothetical protein CSA81_11750 [Acidobacteria bacterium]|nr:MAG: hypothetical protein CSA81_11750 [Acidobacteriota bacterium]